MFTVRELYRKGWAGLSERDDAEAAAELLVELKWLREEEIDTGGRPLTRLRVNPRILEMAPAGTAKTDKSPANPLEGAPSVGFDSAVSGDLENFEAEEAAAEPEVNDLFSAAAAETGEVREWRF